MALPCGTSFGWVCPADACVLTGSWVRFGRGLRSGPPDVSHGSFPHPSSHKCVVASRSSGATTSRSACREPATGPPAPSGLLLLLLKGLPRQTVGSSERKILSSLFRSAAASSSSSSSASFLRGTMDAAPMTTTTAAAASPPPATAPPAGGGNGEQERGSPPPPDRRDDHHHPPRLTDLPRELARKVAVFLPLREVVRLSSTCRSVRTVWNTCINTAGEVRTPWRAGTRADRPSVDDSFFVARGGRRSSRAP
jgi:F-box domain